MNKVWIVMRHDHIDYSCCKEICTICATEELAEEALLWFISGSSKTQEYWIEDHYLNTGKKNETP
jgi:hypothetical protein